MAGRQGFELGARPVSNVVMARDFWFQALESQAVTSLRFVHCRPPESSRFSPRCGDILETALVGRPWPPVEISQETHLRRVYATWSAVRSRSGPPSFAHECRRRMPTIASLCNARDATVGPLRRTSFGWQAKSRSLRERSAARRICDRVQATRTHFLRRYRRPAGAPG